MSIHIYRLLERELNFNRTCESGVVLRKVQDSGVTLFHHLVEFYSEDAALCPPTKQLLTTCIEKLGQVLQLHRSISMTCFQKFLMPCVKGVYQWRGKSGTPITQKHYSTTTSRWPARAPLYTCRRRSNDFLGNVSNSRRSFRRPQR